MFYYLMLITYNIQYTICIVQKIIIRYLLFIQYNPKIDSNIKQQRYSIHKTSQQEMNMSTNNKNMQNKNLHKKLTQKQKSNEKKFTNKNKNNNNSNLSTIHASPGGGGLQFMQWYQQQKLKDNKHNYTNANANVNPNVNPFYINVFDANLNNNNNTNLNTNRLLKGQVITNSSIERNYNFSRNVQQKYQFPRISQQDLSSNYNSSKPSSEGSLLLLKQSFKEQNLYNLYEQNIDRDKQQRWKQQSTKHNFSRYKQNFINKKQNNNKLTGNMLNKSKNKAGDKSLLNSSKDIKKKEKYTSQQQTPTKTLILEVKQIKQAILKKQLTRALKLTIISNQSYNSPSKYQLNLKRQKQKNDKNNQINNNILSLEKTKDKEISINVNQDNSKQKVKLNISNSFPATPSKNLFANNSNIKRSNNTDLHINTPSNPSSLLKSYKHIKINSNQEQKQKQKSNKKLIVLSAKKLKNVKQFKMNDRQLSRDISSNKNKDMDRMTPQKKKITVISSKSNSREKSHHKQIQVQDAKNPKQNCCPQIRCINIF